MNLFGFIKGANITGNTLPEAGSLRYSFEGAEADFTDILQTCGFNCMLLDVFNHPTDGLGDRDTLAPFIQKTMRKGFSPRPDGKRRPPAGLTVNLFFGPDRDCRRTPAWWSEMDVETLKQALFNYSHVSLASFGINWSIPLFVSVGGDLSEGILWPNAKISYENPSSGQWDRLSALLSAAIKGVKLAVPSADIMLPFANQSLSKAERFFDELTGRDLPFDMIALSYRSEDGPFEGFAERVKTLAARYGKQIFLTDGRYANSSLSELEGFFAALEKLHQECPLFMGYFYSEPGAYRGENAPYALFNEKGEALPVLKPVEIEFPKF